MQLLYILIGLTVGALFAWLILRSAHLIDKRNLEKHIAGLDKEKGILQNSLETTRNENSTLDGRITEARSQSQDLATRLARQEVEYKNLQEKLAEQKTEIENIQKKFKDEFENLATRIFEEKSKTFTEQNRNNLELILNPLKENIRLFEKKVEDTYQKGLKDQTDLKAELKNLHDLNIRISDDATNLTKALKGDVKKMGNWGEMVLEHVLERSGLRKGEEYEVQVSARTQEGELIRPDVIIHLPEKKHLIIDSKVSLLAYEASVNSEIPEEKEKFIRQHVDSIRNHVKLLSDKNYQSTDFFITPDFILLFLPMESAFSAAIEADNGLFNFAWEKKIVIVSPTTLLATLKTVESIWRQEKQTQNALEIAQQGGALYDKFVSFIEDMKRLGNQINTVSGTFEEAKKKLFSGKGNIVNRAQKLKELGAKTTKHLSGNLPAEEDSILSEIEE
ncbi:MAG: DNA recombination protein RmuC [Bacteroidetes bacterium]|nr:DNA recombination protein RmuC [Bacteroidota bacterium]